ncbi:MAG: Synerg-CTERM sorting domain-containing protein [Synergistaceae bacterium]
MTWSKERTDNKITLNSSEATKVTFTAAKAGTSVITAKKGTLTATCSVTVLEVPKKIVTASALTLDKNSALVALGGTMQLTAAIEPANADGTFTWSAASTNADVSAVSGKATVKAVKAGTTAVTVTWKGVGGDELKATCNIAAEDMSAPVKAVVKEETVKQLEEKNILVAVTAPVTDKMVIKTETAAVADKIEVASDGSLVMSKVTVDAIAKEIGQSVTPLPVIEAEVPISGDLKQTVIMTMLIPGGSIQAKTVGEMILVKLLNTAKNETLERVGTIEALTSGKWLIKKAFTEEVLDVNAAIDPMQTYEINVAVQDNSAYDLNSELGKVVDPIAASVKTSTADPSKGSSSGCNAGFAALALLAVVPVIYRRKK